MTDGSLTAAHVAVALVAAAKITGADASRVFEDGPGHRRTRTMAAAGLVARLGCSRRATAPMFRVCAPELSPSMLTRAGVTSDHLLIVAEALHAHGLTEGDALRTRFLATEGCSPALIEPARAQTAKPLAAPRTAAARRETGSAGRTVRIRPITGQIVGWAGWFLEAEIWTAEEVADLFDVDPEALLTALEADCEDANATRAGVAA
ncbi:hypothetical protein [Brevundimonas sp. TWP2-3-4b1]|uniref:hypothetical protein n=1 Tax=Brevundimonas sp. TWP2-3-4b1 TaxID=2804580 RepID=UPI003CE699FE